VVSRYHGRPTEKALAASRSNNRVSAQFDGADLEQIESRALKACEEQAKEPCRIVLRNFEVVKEP
jgi:hypothetical protein